MWPIEDRGRFVLPEEFTIYSHDCPRHQPIDARCRCDDDGVWNETKVQRPGSTGAR